LCVLDLIFDEFSRGILIFQGNGQIEEEFLFKDFLFFHWKIVCFEGNSKIREKNWNSTVGPLVGPHQLRNDFQCSKRPAGILKMLLGCDF
jgi:hypothetical protein